jgi:dTMP kinase
VLLDADPGARDPGQAQTSLNDQWRVQVLLAEMAAADPDRYVVVDADGTDDEVAERVRTAVRAVFVGRLSGLAPTEPPEAAQATETAAPAETEAKADTVEAEAAASEQAPEVSEVEAK